MKRIKIVSFILILMFFICTTHVFALEAQITIEGKNSIEPGATQTATVKIASSEIEIGVISGTIEKSSNITNMVVKGINDWTLTYNAERGVFNIYKAEGAKSEEVLTIEYTVANAEGTAEIKMTNLKLTSIDYHSKNVADITKQITIEKEEQTPPVTVTLTRIKVEKEPTKLTYTAGETFEKAGMVIKAEYSDGTSKEVTNYTYAPQGQLKVTDTKITITYLENGVTKTVEQEITVLPIDDENEEQKPNDDDQDPPVDDDKGQKPDDDEQKTPTPEKEDEKKPSTDDSKKDDTEADKDIPHAGIGQGILIAILITGIFMFVTYRKNRKYKDIK